jgi:hypothetical protein
MLLLATSPWLKPPQLVPEEQAQLSSVHRIPEFLSRSDIEALKSAAETVSAKLKQAGKPGVHDLAHRQATAKGTWSTVFINHHLREMLPDLHDRLFSAAREADAAHAWGLFREGEAEGAPLSFRVAELHRVQPGGGLRKANHIDYGSLITLDLMLSEPGVDFEGGALQTLEADGSMASHTFGLGDLLLFQSHKYHSVTPVTAGTRSVCVLEIWEGLPRRCPRRCTDPWGPCTCQFAPKPPCYRIRDGPEHFAPAAVLRYLKEEMEQAPKSDSSHN